MNGSETVFEITLACQVVQKVLAGLNKPILLAISFSAQNPAVLWQSTTALPENHGIFIGIVRDG